jgi:hypothetical protein
MKWIFLTLIAANVLYFLYQTNVEDPATVNTVPQDYPEARPIQLLSERTGQSDRDIEVEEVLENPIQGAATPETSCLGLGPFDNVLMAQNVAERYNTIGFPVELRAVDNPTGEFDYRVVMAPLPSLQEAFRRLRELKSRDIDSYVITQGEDAQGISLGVFSTEQAALVHQQRLDGEGYAVDIKEIPRVLRGYWIYGLEGGDFPATLLESIRQEFSSVEITETACLI